MFSFFDFNTVIDYFPSWILYVMVCISILIILMSFIFDELMPTILTSGIKVIIPVVIVLSLSVCNISSYLLGKQSVIDDYNTKLAQQEEQIKKLQDQSKQITEKVVTQYVTKTKIVRDTNAKIQNMVTTKNDSKCLVTDSTVSLFNGAAENVVPNTAAGTDDSTSTVTYSDLEKSVIENYGIYNQVSEQLKSLQDWIREQQKLNP